MAELIVVRPPPVHWPRRAAIGLTVLLLLFSAKQVLTFASAPTQAPGHDDVLVRRVFFPLSPERPLELEAGDIQERLTIGLLLRYDPLQAARATDVSLRFEWLDAQRQVIAIRNWTKPLRPAPQSREAIGLFVDPGGHRLSSHRNVILPRAPFPSEAHSLRISLEHEVPGELLIRFFTRQLISVGLRAQALQRERLEKFASRSSLPPELLPTSLRDRVRGYTWTTLKAVDEQGLPPPPRPILRRELTTEEREAFFASLSRTLADPTWHEVQGHRPLAFDILEAGRYALEFDRLLSPAEEDQLSLTLRVPGEPERALSLNVIQQAAPLFCPSPATLVLRHRGTPVAVRLRGQELPRAPLIPPASDRRLAYLSGAPEAVSRLLVPVVRELPPDTELPPPPSVLRFEFSPEEIAQQVALRLRVRRVTAVSPDTEADPPPPITVHWQLQGDTSDDTAGGQLLVDLEPRELERLPQTFAHVTTSGPGLVSVRLPSWARTLAVWTDDPALLYADLSLPDVRLPEPVPTEHTPRFLCSLSSDPRGRRFFRVRPSNTAAHELAATAVLLTIQGGLVRGPRDPRPDPSRQVLTLTTGAEAQPFLIPVRPRGTYPRDDGLAPLRHDAYRLLGATEQVDVFREGIPFPRPREVIVLPSDGHASRHLLARGRPRTPPGVSALVSDPGSADAGWTLRHALPASIREPFRASWDHDGQPGYVVLDVIKPDAEPLTLDLDLAPPRRKALTGLPVTVLPTDTQRSFLLEAGSEPRALALNPANAPRGATWRLVIGFGADLPIGELRLEVRPRRGKVWVVARAVRPSRMTRGETWSADVQGVEGVEVQRQGGTADDPLEQVSIVGVHTPLTSPLAPTTVGVSTTNTSGTLSGVRMIGTLPDSRRVLLPRAEQRVRALRLPVSIARPAAGWPGQGVLRAILLWSTDDEQAPPEAPLRVRLRYANGGYDEQLQTPTWRRLERAGRVQHPDHLVWRSRPIYVQLPSTATAFELSGDPALSALVAVRVVAPDPVVFHGGGLPDGGLGRVIPVRAAERFGLASEVVSQRPPDLRWVGEGEPDAAGFTTLTRSFRKEGDWRLLDAPLAPVSEYRMTPRQLTERQDPVLRFEANESESQPLAVAGAVSRVQLSGPAPIRAAAPFSLLRPVEPGAPVRIDLADPNSAPEAFPHVLIRYAGMPVARHDPIELSVFLDGVEIGRERVVVPDGTISIGDVSPTLHDLEVRCSQPIGSGQLWVRTIDHPRPGDMRTLGTWSTSGEKPLLVSLPVDLEPGDLWVIEVFAADRPPLDWSHWTLDLLDRDDRLMRREQHHVFGTTADDAPMRAADGTPAWPLIRVWRRGTYEDARARTAILRGAFPSKVLVRALCVRRSGP